MDKPVFVLGVGCQKGGTTWLHRYLRRHPRCDMGATKEYHIFDGLHLEEFAWTRKRYIYKISEKPKKQKPVRKQYDRQQAELLKSFYEDQNNYADYFWKLAQSSPETRVVGDITPSYCLLPRERLAEIRALLEGRGFDLKVVFILRDPIERTYSHMRMVYRNQGLKPEPAAEPDGPTPFMKFCADPVVSQRNDYQAIVSNLDAVFDADQLYYAFYETLFDKKNVKAMSRFLGIDPGSAKLDRQYNTSPKSFHLAPEEIAWARKRLHPVYKFVAKRFGRRKLIEAWPHFRPDLRAARACTHKGFGRDA